MEKDEVLVDLENFSCDQKVEGARQVFEKIEHTVRKDNSSKSACVMIHLDQEMDSRVSTFISGNPENTIQVLNNALKVAISQGVKPEKKSRQLLFNAIRLLIEVDSDKLGLDKEKKLALEKSIATIGIFAITC